MEDKLQDYADELIQLIREGADFVGEQAPLFVQELLTYYTAYHTIWLAVGLVLLTVSWRLYKYAKYSEEEIVLAHDVAGLLSAITFLVGAGVTLTHVFGLVKVLVAPRLYLLEALQRIF